MSLLVAIVAIVAIALILAGVFGWYYLLGHRNGERFMRRRAQGPFVPLTDEPEDHVAERDAQRL